MYKYVTSTSKDGNRQFYKVLEIDVDSAVGVLGGGGGGGGGDIQCLYCAVQRVPGAV